MIVILFLTKIISEVGISKYNNKNKEEPFIKYMLGNCENLLNEIFYYRNKNSGYNIVSRIINEKKVLISVIGMIYE